MTNFEAIKMGTAIILIKGSVRKSIHAHTRWSPLSFLFHLPQSIGCKQGMAMLMVALFLLTGCKPKKKTEDILSPAEMSRLLVEFYQAEARLSFLPVSRDSAMKLFVPFERSFLEKEKISDEMLKRTYRYYLDRPAELGKIYDSVIDTLSLRQHRAGTVR